MSPSKIPKLNLNNLREQQTPLPKKKINAGPALEKIVGTSMVFAGMYCVTRAVRKHPCPNGEVPPPIAIAGIFLLGLGMPMGSSEKIKSVAAVVGLVLALLKR